MGSLECLLEGATFDAWRTTYRSCLELGPPLLQILTTKIHLWIISHHLLTIPLHLSSLVLIHVTLETSPFVIHPRHWRKARPWASTPWDLHQQWRWVEASSNHHLFEIQTEVDYTPPVGDTFLCKTGSCPLIFLSTNPPSLFPSPPSQSCYCQNPGFKSPGLEIVGRRFEKQDAGSPPWFLSATLSSTFDKIWNYHAFLSNLI